MKYVIKHIEENKYFSTTNTNGVFITQLLTKAFKFKKQEIAANCIDEMEEPKKWQIIQYDD